MKTFISTLIVLFILTSITVAEEDFTLEVKYFKGEPNNLSEIGSSYYYLKPFETRNGIYYISHDGPSGTYSNMLSEHKYIPAYELIYFIMFYETEQSIFLTGKLYSMSMDIDQNIISGKRIDFDEKIELNQLLTRNIGIISTGEEVQIQFSLMKEIPKKEYEYSSNSLTLLRNQFFEKKTVSSSMHSYRVLKDSTKFSTKLTIPKSYSEEYSKQLAKCITSVSFSPSIEGKKLPINTTLTYIRTFLVDTNHVYNSKFDTNYVFTSEYNKEITIYSDQILKIVFPADSPVPAIQLFDVLDTLVISP